jgi:RNA polymerase sigma factor (sigma-70 family)
VSAKPAPLVRHVRRLAAWPEADPVSDAALLERWVRVRDEDAFAALVARHGPMVLGVCRHVLSDAHAAEDALQATFLVLARRAAAVRPATALAAWLFGVARKVARKARAAERRRRTAPVSAAALRQPEDPLERLSARELLTLVDEEVARLPERYRLPVVVCCLEGRSVEESARLLGWKVGSVKGRLERGRRLLRTRLARRGVELAALLAVGLTVEAGRPAPRAAATTAAALAFAAGRQKNVSGPEALARCVMGRAAISAPRLVAALLVALGVATGAGTLVLAPRADEPADRQPPATAEPSKDNPGAGVAAGIDRFGDPLPAGALARLGTVQLRHNSSNILSVAFSRDGKSLVAADSDCVCTWDPATGRLIRTLRPERGTYGHVALTPDGELAAVVALDGHIGIWNTATGKELRRLEGDGDHALPVFSPDGKLLATSNGRDKVINVWSVSSGNKAGQVTGKVSVPRAFSPDGNLLVAWDRDRKLSVNHIAGERLLYRLEPGTLDFAGLSFSPDGKVLAVTRDTAVDLHEVETGRLLHRLDGHAVKALAVGFGPGGILVSTDCEHIARSWDWRTGKELCRGKAGFAADHEWGYRDVLAMAFSPDGKTVAFVGSGTAVRLWDPATGKERLPREAHDWNLMAVAYSPDGHTVATGASGGDSPLRLWSAKTGQSLASSGKSKPVGFPLVFTPDGREIVGLVSNITRPRESPVRVWDAASARQVRSLETDGAGDKIYRAGAVALLPGGKTVRAFLYEDVPAADNGRDATMSVQEWDLATGQRSVKWRRPQAKAFWPALSADGSLLALQVGPRVKVLDAVTGRSYRDLDGRCESTWKLGFSADGRLVAANCCVRQPDGSVRWEMAVWELITGKEIRRFGVDNLAVNPVFSPDGRVLAASGHPVPKFPLSSTFLYDLASGRQLQRLNGHEASVMAAAFAPDGRTLTTGHNDGSALVWDVTPAMRQAAAIAVERGPEALELAWTALAGEDGAAALTAQVTLAAAPEQATAFLRGRLRPAGPPGVSPAKLVADLDSDEFRVRESAAHELVKLGSQSEAALRAALAAKPSAELRRQAENLLERLDGPVTDGEKLRQLRAVAALERIGASAALRELAGGVPDARLTREAKASLARLEARTTPGRP